MSACKINSPFLDWPAHFSFTIRGNTNLNQRLYLTQVWTHATSPGLTECCGLSKGNKTKIYRIMSEQNNNEAVVLSYVSFRGGISVHLFWLMLRGWIQNRDAVSSDVLRGLGAGWSEWGWLVWKWSGTRWVGGASRLPPDTEHREKQGSTGPQ